MGIGVQPYCCPGFTPSGSGFILPGGSGGSGADYCLCEWFDDDALPPGVAPCSIWGTLSGVTDLECEDCESNLNGKAFEFVPGNCSSAVGGFVLGWCPAPYPYLNVCEWVHEFDPPFCATDCENGAGGNVTIKCSQIGIYHDPTPPWNHAADEYSVVWQVSGYHSLLPGTADCCWVAHAVEDVTATGQNNKLNWSDIDGLVFDSWGIAVGTDGPSVCGFDLSTTGTLSLSA